MVFLLCGNLLSAQVKDEKIAWDPDRPLSWSDFKGEPDASSSYTANTNSGIGYTWSYSTASGEPQLTFEVSCNFYPKLSWVKNPADPDYLLAHEQLHFDISELYARKLKKALAEYEPGRSIRQDLRNIYNKYESERVSAEKQFDRETRHSEDYEAEMAWRKKIAQELERLKNYNTSQN
ncbi:DUF922 domain-containing protein [Christiangramia fulva]|uniref:DUF922 domain-containing protein n=1 Tax=Christiangramia fulva TaxID=2126553 RepID=UPI001D058C91|nr:DUF922 domain-containing protein [Christiangramia fulva]